MTRRPGVSTGDLFFLPIDDAVWALGQVVEVVELQLILAIAVFGAQFLPTAVAAPPVEDFTVCACALVFDAYFARGRWKGA